MFKTASFEDEIYQAMEKQLVANQVEDKHGLKKLAQAVEYLNSAAEIFEQAGMSDQAHEVTDVVAGLAKHFYTKTA